MKLHIAIIGLATVLATATTVTAGPLAWAACQTACNAGYVTCCTAGGAIAGWSRIDFGPATPSEP